MAEWGVPLDTFYSTKANYKRERGFTIPRLKALVDAYNRRRGRELRELAIAHHDPPQLNDLYPLTTPQQATDVAPMERTRWW